MKEKPLQRYKELPYYLRDAETGQIVFKAAPTASLNHQTSSYVLTTIYKPICIFYATPETT